MATGGGPIYTPETANGARLQALLIDEGTKLVRKVFDQEVSRMNPPASLQVHLLSNQHNLVRFLNPDQEKVLYPTAGSAANSTQDFDITLLTLLLGRLCNMRPPHTGWSQEPPVGDKSPIAWIIRLKLFRNRNYAHIANTALSNTKFKKLWKKLSDILRGLGGDQNKILRRKTETIDPEQAKMYQEKFERLHRQDNEVKDLLVAQGAQAAAQLSSLDENVQKQTSEIKKTRKELLHIERTQGKQHKQLSDELFKQKAMMVEEKRQLTEMKMTGEDTLRQLKTSVQQQHGAEKAIIAEGHKQAEEIKTTVKESISELKEELIKEKPPVAEEAKPSAEGEKGTIEKLRNHVQDRYRRELARVRPLPWCEDFYLDLEHMFTTLEMVRRDGRKNDTTVTVEDMFQLQNDDKFDPKTIRVEGDPGIGKTTLCYKIVYNCSAVKSKFVASNKFASFRLVLYVEMRQVPHDATDLKSTIFKQVFPESYYKHEEVFWSYVERNPDVLFVLDGLDEMPEETRENLKITEFIRGQITPGVYVIVTSRPYLCNRQLSSCNRHFMIKGYSRENIKSYIHKHPTLDSNSKEGMLKQLNENGNLHQLTENPLNLALLCILWKEDWNNADLPQTLTGLYSLLVLAIVKRYAEKCLGISDVSNLSLEEMPEPIEEKLNQLSHLAWEGVKEDHLHFSGKTVKSLVEIGFLTKDLNLTTAIQQPFWFQFLHKTFQEYFAARHLHSLCVTSNGEQSSKASDTLNKYVQNYDRYHQVLKFLAGLLGPGARCLFEAFHDCLSKEHLPMSKIPYLCLECLHECNAGTEQVKYVSDVLGRDWLEVNDDRISFTTMSDDDQTVYYPYSNCCNVCVLNCRTNISTQIKLSRRTYFIYSKEALYGLVHLLLHQAEQHSAQDSPQLSNVHLELDTGFDDARYRLLRAVSGTKVFSFLSVNLHGYQRHDDPVINEVCNLLQSDAYRDLSFDISQHPWLRCTSSFDTLNKVLSSVQSETKLNLTSRIYLDGILNTIREVAFSKVINEMVRLGGMTRDGDCLAIVAMYINCAADTYLPESVSSCLTNIVTTIKQCQFEGQGSFALEFIIRNLPLAEKPAVQSQLAEISSILEGGYCIFRVIKFECSCEDGSVVSTMSLLQSLTLNKSLTEVSFLFDDPHNVAECLCHIFAKNKTLQELEIIFPHPVEDETMANIFGSYPTDNPCQIKSFAVVMETGHNSSHTGTMVRNQNSYELTIRAILYICKNMCDGSALQKISFTSTCITSTGNTKRKTRKTQDKVPKVIPVCPGSLLKPLVEAIVDSQSQLSVNLAGLAWVSVNVTDFKVTDQERTKYSSSQNFKNSNLGLDKNTGKFAQTADQGEVVFSERRPPWVHDLKILKE